MRPHGSPNTTITLDGVPTARGQASGNSCQRPSSGEYDEMKALGMLSDAAAPLRQHDVIERHVMRASSVLNEAYEYTRPSSFSRGVRFDLGDRSLVLISGTASIDSSGCTRHVGDFRAQLWRTYRNISELLAAEGATWHDVVRTTCYLRDIERDYRDFNEVRTLFFNWLGLEPLPASTAIQARLCREDLLVEIEGIAIMPSRREA